MTRRCRFFKSFYIFIKCLLTELFNLPDGVAQRVQRIVDETRGAAPEAAK